ncbi:MAG: sodium:solute symporter family protein [Myxococcota bacterium]
MRTVDLSLLTVALVFTVAVCGALGLWAGRCSNNKQDYFLANRQLGWLPLSLTLVATQIGAGMMLGTSQEAFTSGIVGLFYSAGMGLGFLILGFGVAGRLRELNLCTTAQLFETHYGSKMLRRFASLLSVATLGGLLTGQVVASQKILSPIAGEWTLWLMAILWGTLIIYTLFGGLRAVVATDMLQVGIIVAALLATLGICWVGNLHTASAHVWVSTRAGTTATVPWHKWQSVLLMPACYALIEQDLAQRFFSSKNRRCALLAALIAAIAVILLALLPLYFGLLARDLLPATQQPTSHPLLLLMDSLGNPLLSCAMLCALLAAVSSTADSLLCAMASNVVYDFGQAGNIKLSRLVTAIVGITALLLAPLANSVLEVLTLSYTLSVSCLFVPIMACLFKKQVYTQAAWTSALLGLFGFFATFLQTQAHQDVNPLPALLLSLAGYIVATLWEKKQTHKGQKQAI